MNTCLQCHGLFDDSLFNEQRNLCLHCSSPTPQTVAVNRVCFGQYVKATMRRMEEVLWLYGEVYVTPPTRYYPMGAVLDPFKIRRSPVLADHIHACLPPSTGPFRGKPFYA